jgi:hypothetical protein
VDPATGRIYRDEFAGTRQNVSGRDIEATKCGDSFAFNSVAFPGKRFVLTPVDLLPLKSPAKEVPLTDAKCPIRSLFDDAQITFAYAMGLKQGAALLSECTDNGSRTAVTVSRQLFRFWCIDLGVHVPKSARKVRAEELKLKGTPKILLIDIETAPILGYVWSLWKQNVGLNQIKEEWYILSYCAKWLGEDGIIYRDVRHDPHSDASLLPELWELLNEADIIIGQNGKAFDIPKIQARMVMAGMLPPRPFKVIDTLLMAKQQFRFTSNRLEWMTGDSANLTEISKSKHAKYPGFALWAECLKGNMEAWDEMREYNVPDVTSMEQLYLRLRPWYVGHPNLAAYVESEEVLCPRCLSPDVKQDGFTFTQTGKYEMYTCGGCGGWSRGRYTRNTTGKRKALLTN